DFGLIIDLAKDVKTIDEKDISPISGLISNSKGYVTSTINLNNEIIQVVSIENIIAASSLEQPSGDIMLIESKTH
ncbi:MAG TPA: chemotaxis protein CheW, partial [Fusibacter sp.]|nr:chemotaxis protein CheW [Fusibacter sp.]